MSGSLPKPDKVRTICVDFDGVMHSYKSGWCGIATIPDPPVDGAIGWLERMSKHFKLAIFSTRNQDPAGVGAMKAWFMHWYLTYQPHKSPYDARKFVEKLSFPAEKPIAFAYIDDRAIQFRGDFSVLTEEFLSSFKPWHEEMPRD